MQFSLIIITESVDKIMEAFIRIYLGELVFRLDFRLEQRAGEIQAWPAGARGKRPSLSLQILVAAAWPPPPILAQSSKIDMGDRGLELLSPKFPSEESNVTQNIFLHSYPPLCLVFRAGGFSCIYNNA